MINFEQYFQEGKSENMPRLPIPGSDMGSWGDILNEFLDVSHDGNGALKANSVSGAQLQAGSVTHSKLGTTNSPASGEVLSYNGSGLAWVAPGSAPVSSVAGKTGAVTLVKADVGLGSVDDTSDANKPVSTAVQAALDTKTDKSTTITAGTGLSGGGDLSTDLTLNVADDSTTQKVEVAENGTLQGTRKQVNFIAGSNTTLSVDDNGTDNRVDVTISSAGTAGAIQDTITPQTANIAIQSGSAGDIGIRVKGAGGQAADLQQWQDSNDTSVARVKADGSLHTAGTLTVGSSVLLADPISSSVTIQGPSSAPARGTELFGAFTVASGWTLSNGDLTAAHASGGGTTSIATTLSGALTVGAIYDVSFYLSGRTTGTILPNLGGNSGHTTNFNNSTANHFITASTTATLSFTPSSDFNGTLSNISVKPVIATTPALTIKNTNGTVGIELRSGGNGESTYIGEGAGASSGGGFSSTAWNTAVGAFALQNNVSGLSNTAIGYNALKRTTQGNNTAVGAGALSSATTGYPNVALGHNSLATTTTGSFNVASGYHSLIANTTGNSNTASGHLVMSNNTTGSDNTAMGQGALYSTTTGNENVGIGMYAINNNTTGVGNASVGLSALHSNSTGSFNTALGYRAGHQDGTAWNTSATLQQSTALGAYAQVQASNSMVLGRGGTANQTKVGIGTTMPTNVLSVTPTLYDTGTASQSTTTVTGTGTTFTVAMVGGEIVFSNGVKATITGFNSATSMTVTPSQTVSSRAYRIHSPGLQVTSTGNTGLGALTPSSRLDVDGAVTVRGIVSPIASPANQGRIYYDTTDNKFKVSQNGGSYVDLVGSGGTPEVTLNGVETLTNKRITNRVASQASSATPTPNSDTTDVYVLTALAADAVFAAPTGAPTDGQRLVIRLKDDGSPRALAYNGIYRPIGVTLPTVTTGGKTIYIEARFNTLDTKWDVILAAVEA